MNSTQADFVRNLFSTISQTYDRTNDIMTFGLARIWRKKLVAWSGVRPGQKILDCATGTGDLAFEFKNVVGESGTVTGIDFCPEMLVLAREKSTKMNQSIIFKSGNVLSLDFMEGEFDATTIAYGIRNVADMNLALKEMARVTKPGGHVLVLETGEISNPVLRFFIRFYFEQIVPRIGGWISGKPEAYQYLQKSSKVFPSGAEFCQILANTNCFSQVTHKSVLGGASYLYKAQKL